MPDKYFGDSACQGEARQSIFRAAGHTRSSVNYFIIAVEIDQFCKNAGREV
jgi:hypothetical protein